MILIELKKRADHPTAHELYLAVKEQLPHLSLGTVYRNLEQMCLAGQVRKLEFAGGQKRYDGESHPHQHFRCVSCGLLEDVPFEMKPEQTEHPWLMEREIFSMHCVYTGLCPECKVKDRK